VAAQQLRAFVNQVEAMLRSGRLTIDQAEPLIDLAQQAIDGLVGDPPVAFLHTFGGRLQLQRGVPN
jgi:hypothetical protein